MTSVVMPANTITTLTGLQTPADFKKHVMANITKDVEKLGILYNQVLLAIYFRPEKTAGDIYRPDTSKQEDMWQGKVGLVVGVGPNAFQDDETFSFHGQRAEIGDWVVFKVGDAWSLQVGGFPCRLVADNNIRMKTSDPSVVF